jgi:hypothetical protein
VRLRRDISKRHDLVRARENRLELGEDVLDARAVAVGRVQNRFLEPKLAVRMRGSNVARVQV